MCALFWQYKLYIYLKSVQIESICSLSSDILQFYFVLSEKFFIPEALNASSCQVGLIFHPDKMIIFGC